MSGLSDELPVAYGDGMNTTIQKHTDFLSLSVLCGKSYWDSSSVWDTNDNGVDVCIGKTLLVWPPCFFLWICAVFQVIYFWKKPYDPLPWTVLTVTRVMVSGSQVVMASFKSMWIRRVADEGPPKTEIMADSIGTTLLILTFSLQLVMVTSLRLKGIRSSGVLLSFNLLMILFGIPTIKRIYMETLPRKEEILSIIHIFQYVSCVILLISQSVNDRPSKSQKHDQTKNSSPENSAPFLSLVTFTWTFPIIWKGFKKTLMHENLFDLPPKHTASVLIEELENTKKRYEFKQKKTRSSIIWLLFKIFKKELICAGLLYTCNQAVNFLVPEILSWLIEFTGNINEPTWKGILYAILLFVSKEAYIFFGNLFYYNIQLTTIRCRSLLMQNIYRKSLQLSVIGRRQATHGEIVNLMAVDTYKISNFFINIFSAIGTPIVILVSLIKLWEHLGAAVLSGLLVLVLQVPLTAFISQKVKDFQEKLMEKKDCRLKLINEIINGIKVLKMNAWEESFAKQAGEIRQKESSVLQKREILNCPQNFFFNVTPTLVAIASFATYLFISETNELDAKKAFVSLALFNIMSSPLMSLYHLITDSIQAKVSLDRMDKYLAAPEVEKEATSTVPENMESISVENGDFTWGEEFDINSEDRKGAFQLKNIDIKVKAGSLVAVVGSVGAGKSSLVSAILGEMERKKGHVTINGSVAYVSQVSWIQNTTVQENITWGKQFNSNFYNSVISACALQPDLDMLPGGDQTEIGEKGINLSGGQKQRLSLARAVYNDADIFLMDDPLSAVDAHVGKHMFDHVIGPQGLLRNKTRFFVTHSLSILPHVDEVIVVKDGHIQERGTYLQLINLGGEIAQFIQQHSTPKSESHDSAEDFVENALCFQTETGKENDSNYSESKHNIYRNRGSKKSSGYCKSEPIVSECKKVGPTMLIKDETTKTGLVSGSVYAFYCNAIGVIWLFVTILLSASSQGALLGSNLWLSYLSDQPADGVNCTEKFDRYTFLVGYGGFGLLQAMTFLGSIMMVVMGALHAGMKLHNNLLDTVIRLPMSFFDTNPSGRVMNLFSKDVDALDSLLPYILHMVINCPLRVLFTFVIIMLSTPQASYAMVPIIIIYITIQRIHIPTARQLKRIEAVGKSPILSHLSETLQGFSVIRAFDKGQEFQNESMKKVDHYQTAAYNNIATDRWIGVAAETLGNIITFVVALVAVLNRGLSTPGTVGLTITYALDFTVMLNWVVVNVSKLESNIVSVERIKEYIEEKREAFWRLTCDSGISLPGTWPTEGAIEFKNYQMRYRPELELVLRGINFSVKPSEKIGIVGRTGAGKSSITLSLLRLVEAAGGSISIDGQDISQIGLHDIREKLSFIPQDPVLFSGPLRMNLDPFNIHEDESLWQSLEHANLQTFVRNLPYGLQHIIEEGGANFSVGQRQLICLARALLRQSRVLVIDEATASVDLDTDGKIQETIRREFKHCTVLTIAHRLNTIIDYDRVLVLDKGLIVEYDSPSSLLGNENSIFHEMAKDAGLFVNSRIKKN